MTAHISDTNAVSNGVSSHDQQALIDSRQALLSYAAMYPFIYGPTGAGPAHLPCPDTDGYALNSAAAESGSHQRRDGPDPPCTSYLVSDGLLPRHVSLPGHRYAFHSQAWQRFHYSVAGTLVNNPLNRIVNLPVLREQESLPAATIRLSLADVSSRFTRVVLTHRALIDASIPAVIAWIMQRANDRLLTVCESSLSEAARGVLAHQAQSMAACVNIPKLVSGCDREHLLALMLDTPLSSSDDCLVDRLTHNMLEGVPAKRHWFVRNQWYLSVRFVYAEECVPGSAQASLCKLVYPQESRVAIARGSLAIELHWVLPV